MISLSKGISPKVFVIGGRFLLKSKEANYFNFITNKDFS